MLDSLVASRQFRDCFIFLPQGCRLSDYTGYCWVTLAEEDSVANPLKTPHFSVSSPSYVMPSCESDARAKSVEADDPFKDRELPGRRHGPARAGTFTSLGFSPLCGHCAGATVSSISVFPISSTEQGMLGRLILGTQTWKLWNLHLESVPCPWEHCSLPLLFPSCHKSVVRDLEFCRWSVMVIF